MKIALYMERIAYKYGGAEAYTANIIQALQSFFPDAVILLITEQLSGKRKVPCEEVIKMLNTAYGTSIKSTNIYIKYFKFRIFDTHTMKKSLVRDYLNFKRAIEQIKRYKCIIRLSKGTDLFFNCSFNIISSSAKRKICIVHFPFPKELNLNSKLNKFFYFRNEAIKRDNNYCNNYNLYFPNSNFTKSNLKKKWDIEESKIKILYPPVQIVKNRISDKKMNQIMMCSRIDPLKKIDVVLEALNKSAFIKENVSIVVAGSVIGENVKYVQSLMKANPNVKFLFDLNREDLERVYIQSLIFIHAMGYGEIDPQKFEHFGCATVEAMSAGCIPVVINKGGQTEIVEEGKTGFKWDTLQELINKIEWILKNPEKAKEISRNAREKSIMFSYDEFKNRFIKEININEMEKNN